jgi:Fe-Mn family superoxide dismutase
MSYATPRLPYDYNALEPYLDTTTLELHYGKHHMTYTTKLNDAMKKHPELGTPDITSVLSHLETIPADIRPAVRNFGGGHHNHILFWENMSPDGGGEPTGPVAAALQQTFGNLIEFRAQFTQSATTLFGSGWTWLVRDAAGKLSIINTANQDSPLSSGLTPLLALDIWEHSYYLKFQNRRPDYISAWWNVVNWQAVEQRFNQ